MNSNNTSELLDQEVPLKNDHVMISFSVNATVLMQDWSSQITDVEDSGLLDCHAEWQVIDSMYFEGTYSLPSQGSKNSFRILGPLNMKVLHSFEMLELKNPAF
jgi:hypothetical protein